MEKTKSSVQIFIEHLLETHAVSDEGMLNIRELILRNTKQINEAYFKGYQDGVRGFKQTNYYENNFIDFSPFEEKLETTEKINGEIIWRRIENEREEILNRMNKSLNELFEGIVKDLKK